VSNRPAIPFERLSPFSILWTTAKICFFLPPIPMILGRYLIHSYWPRSAVNEALCPCFNFSLSTSTSDENSSYCGNSISSPHDWNLSWSNASSNSNKIRDQSFI
jgi:hypothetical protein